MALPSKRDRRARVPASLGEMTNSSLAFAARLCPPTVEPVTSPQSPQADPQHPLGTATASWQRRLAAERTAARNPGGRDSAARDQTQKTRLLTGLTPMARVAVAPWTARAAPLRPLRRRLHAGPAVQRADPASQPAVQPGPEPGGAGFCGRSGRRDRRGQGPPARRPGRTSGKGRPKTARRGPKDRASEQAAAPGQRRPPSRPRSSPSPALSPARPGSSCRRGSAARSGPPSRCASSGLRRAAKVGLATGSSRAPDLAGRTFGRLTVLPAIIIAAWLLTGLPLLLAGEFLPVPMLLISAPLATALGVNVLQRVPEPLAGRAAGQVQRPWLDAVVRPVRHGARRRRVRGLAALAELAVR